MMVLPVSPLAAAPKRSRTKPRPMPPIDAPALQTLSFVLEGPPVPKKRARQGRSRGGGQHWYTPKQTVRYEKAIEARAALYVMATFGASGWPRETYYRLTVHAFFADGRSQDADNVLKSVADGCEGVLWRNDALVLDVIAKRRIDALRPRTEITVEVIA